MLRPAAASRLVGWSAASGAGRPEAADRNRARARALDGERSGAERDGETDLQQRWRRDESAGAGLQECGHGM